MWGGDVEQDLGMIAREKKWSGDMVLVGILEIPFFSLHLVDSPSLDLSKGGLLPGPVPHPRALEHR